MRQQRLLCALSLVGRIDALCGFTPFRLGSRLPRLWDVAEERERAEWMVPATARPLDEAAFEVRTSSPEKGLGLFAARPIEKGAFLFDYTGALLLDDDYDGLSDYAVGVANAAGTEYIIDASDPAAGLCRYLNHAPTRGSYCNCACMRGAQLLELADDEAAVPPRLHMFTRRDVAAGEELCWDYGDEYWLGDSPGAIAFRERLLVSAEAGGGG